MAELINPNPVVYTRQASHRRPRAENGSCSSAAQAVQHEELREVIDSLEVFDHLRYVLFAAATASGDALRSWSEWWC